MDDLLATVNAIGSYINDKLGGVIEFSDDFLDKQLNLKWVKRDGYGLPLYSFTHKITFDVLTSMTDPNLYAQYIIDKCVDPEWLIKSNLNKVEPPPQQNDETIVWDLVLQDMRERDEKGFQKYHTHLQPFNGRDALIDAYQEALDLVVYLRQLIYERDMENDGS